MVNNNMDVIGFDEGWNIMQTGITKLKRILEGKSVEQFNHDEYMKAYTTIYGMCINKPPHDYSQQLYDKYKECYDDYINSTVVPVLREKHGEFMLRELVNKWINHQVMLRWLSRFFHYLNRYFISRRLLPSLQEVGLTCFRDLVYEEFKVNATDIVIAQIEREREGQLINRAMLKNVLDIFVEVGMGKLDFYQNDFEDSMLNDTAAYYSRKASIWIVEDSCPEYMLKVEECLKKEMDRVSHYLHYSTETKLIEKLQYELLVVHTNRLLEKEQSGCQALLRNDKVEDLSRMYRLFHDIPEGLEKIANMFNQHVVSEGTILVQQAENDATNKIFVRKVMDLHDKYSTYVTDCFSNHVLFQKAFKGAFEFFCNKKVGDNSNAEVLASFCDDVLKQGGSEKLSDEAIEETLDKVIKLLVYISDKDLFAEVHRKKLSRRLLFDKSSNDDHERLVLTKLKQLCGSEFTSKMEGMVTDLILAKEGNNHFQDYLSLYETPNPGIDFTVSVLTTGFWPNYKSSDMCLPVEMANCVQVFKDYYESKTKHKKLTWMYSLGTCHINGKFAQKTIELIVGTYQAAILLLFNSCDKLSYSDIKNELNMDDEDLIRLLHSLACAKYKILTKDPNTKSVSTSDSFTFNYEFTDKIRRIRVPLPIMEEKKKIVENVDNDRRYAIDAAIVRIMKSRKVMGHQQLVVECTEMLSKTFKPDMKAIKKRIENLMSRDFLERDPEDPNTFRYLA